MDHHSRHVRCNGQTSGNARPVLLSGDPERAAGTGSARIRPRGIALTTAAASAVAGAMYWHWTRSAALSLGVVAILAMAGAVAGWLHAREEARQVEARERGVTEREWIRHYAEAQLADAYKSLIMATTCGPVTSPGDADAVRKDARKVLGQSAPASLHEAMQITRRAQIPTGTSAHEASEATAS